MYTIQFGVRAHFIEDDAARAVSLAMEAGDRFVTVPIDLAADDCGTYTVTLNVSHMVAVMKHRDGDAQDGPKGPVKLMAVN